MARGLKLGLSKKRDGNSYVAKTKVLISCEVTAQLICAFVFAFRKSKIRLSQLIICLSLVLIVTPLVAHYYLSNIGSDSLQTHS